MSNKFLLSVRQHAKTTPHKVAYRTAAEGPTTYGRLWELACAVAQRIRTADPATDAAPDAATGAAHAPIMVVGGKHAATVASFLGCLLSGHAFVPVEPTTPAARMHEIFVQLDNARVIAVDPLPEEFSRTLAASELVDVYSVGEDAAAEPAEEGWVSGESVNYIIFTSGSTGCPKGIQVTANNVFDLAQWMSRFPVVGDGGRVFLDQAHYSFDLSEYQLVGALYTGGTLHAVADSAASDFSGLFEDLKTSGVEVWVSIPSFAGICLVDPSFTANLLPNLKMFLFCGEVLPKQVAEALRKRFPAAIIANTYGPTEATVAVTYCEISDADIASDLPLPVGAPGIVREGTELRIVNRDTLEPCAPGETGEIVIAGASVSLGYYKNPEKTRAAFFTTELSDGTPARAFRTGDAGNLSADGILYCQGRFTSFIKLNGFRIELDEVEGAISRLPGVSLAAVVTREKDGFVHSLKAFVKLSDDTSGEASDLARLSKFEAAQAIKEELGKKLPAYMIPRAIKVVPDLPLTANGKIDRKALQSL